MSQLEERTDQRISPNGTARTLLTVEREVETVLPTRHGPFRMLGFKDAGGMTHVALVKGLTDPGPGTTPLVRDALRVPHR